MSLLEDDALDEWLGQHGEAFRRCIHDLELTEAWPADITSLEIDAAVIELGRDLDQVAPHMLQELGRTELLPYLALTLAHLRAGRRLRLLEFLAAVIPPTAATHQDLVDRLLALNGSQQVAEAARILRECLTVVHRRHVLERLFAPERMSIVLSALHGVR